MSCKSLIQSLSVLFLAACATANPAVTPGIASGLSTAPDRVWVTGSSNFSTFSCRATQIAVSAEASLEDIDRTRIDGLPAVKSGGLAIPIRSLDCGMRQMNDDLLRTLGGDRSGTISFRMGDYVVLEGPAPRLVRMHGLLRLAGTERQLTLSGTVLRDRTGELRLTGEREIDVRDYGITPPTKFFGIVRVRRQVTVHFDVAVRPLIDPMGILTASMQ
jgi:polyisoprenoid-binding protein YceI